MNQNLKIPIEEYHKSPAIGSTDIGRLLERPSLFKAHRDGAAKEESKCLDIGHALHTLVLEPDLFPQQFISTDLDGRSKAYKEFVEANAGKTILRSADLDLVKGMSEGILRNGTARDLLTYAGEVETSYFWQDRVTKVDCKCRPDKAIFDYRGRTVLIDVKTTTDASDRGFSKSMAVYGYHRQAYWYSHGAELVTGTPIDLFVFVVVEKTPPYDCGVYMVSEAALEIAEAECRSALDLYRKCTDTNTWPGLPNGVVEVSLPGWYDSNK